MPRTHMFIDSPELYDAIYHFKNYARECDRLRSLINEVVPGARTILDVACGTGAHAKFLKHHYAVDGIDINENYLLAARLKNPSGNYTRADNRLFQVVRGTHSESVCIRPVPARYLDPITRQKDGPFLAPTARAKRSPARRASAPS
jgi:SAM-dependent methyltransferase